MHWATNRLIHFDRVASAWLIRRFVDTAAEFTFVEHGGPSPEGSISFGIAGRDIGGLDKDGCAFTKIMRRYDLKDPALLEVEKIVVAGVAYVTKGQEPEAGDRHGWIAVGLLSVAEGTAVIADSDHDILARSLPVWDAVYVDAGIHLLRTHPPGAPTDSEPMRGTRFAMAITRLRHMVGGN